MSKAAVIELEPLDINMIHPGGIETKGKGVPTYYDSVFLGQIGQPIEIAKAVVFWTSN